MDQINVLSKNKIKGHNGTMIVRDHPHNVRGPESTSGWYLTSMTERYPSCGDLDWERSLVSLDCRPSS